MASGLHKFTVVEAQNISLGQAGSFMENSTTDNSGLKIVAISFLEATKFTKLIPASSDFIGTSNGGGDDINTSTDSFPAGLTIYGQWTQFQLASGGCIAYLGAF